MGGADADGADADGIAPVRTGLVVRRMIYLRKPIPG
jgi:hypothetical protein